MSANLDARVTWKDIVAFAVISLLWGSGWMIASGYRGLLPPLLAQALSLLIAAGLLALVMLLRRIPLPRGRELRASVFLGLGMVALPFAPVQWAGSRMPGGLVVVLLAFMPLLAIFAALLFRSDRWVEAPPVARNAAVCGIGGIALLVPGALHLTLSQASAAAAVLIAVAVQALSLVYAKKRLAEVDSLATAAVQLATGTVFLAAAGLVFERGETTSWSASGCLMLLLSGIAAGVSFWLLYWLLRRVEPWQAATLAWGQSLIAVAEGALLLHERPPLVPMMGAIVVLASLLAVFKGKNEAADALTLKVTPQPPHS